MGDKLSKKILEQARQQQDELEEEYGTERMAKPSFSTTSKSSKLTLSAGMMDSDETSEDDEQGSDIGEDFCAEQFYENIVSRNKLFDKGSCSNRK